MATKNIERTALVPISGKPYTKGHDSLVRLASKESDNVHLYVSLSDRKRPGEVAVLGSDMELIWKRYIEPTLPSNVAVTYGGSPVRNVWTELGKASESTDDSTKYVVYSDVDDLKSNFPEASLQKYAGRLYDEGLVELRPVARTETFNTSGTAVRKFIQDGDKESFVESMPDSINADEVWNVLSSSAKKHALKSTKVKAESTLRSYIVERVKSCINSAHFPRR